MIKEYVIFKFFGNEFNVKKIDETVAQLEEFGCARTKDVEELEDFISALRCEIRMQKYNEESAMKNIAELYSVLEEYKDIKIYNSSKVDLFALNRVFDRAFYQDGYCRNSFFEFMNLVEGLNAYYRISNPTKAYNKVAYGWDKGYKKTESKTYLYVCIENYLKDNGVKVEAKDLRGIVFGNFR